MTPGRYVRTFCAPLSHAPAATRQPRGSPADMPIAVDAIHKTPSGSQSIPSRSPLSTSTTLPAVLTNNLIDELLRNPVFMSRAADEVGEAIFNGEGRARLRASLQTLLVTRMVAYGEAAALFERVQKELAQPWRLQQDAETGLPAATQDVVSMGHMLLAEMRTSEDLVIRGIKLALDEEKSRGELGGTEGPLDATRFSGAAERVPIPADLTPQDREAVRNLITGLNRFVERRRAITVAPAQQAAPRPSDSASHHQGADEAVPSPAVLVVDSKSDVVASPLPADVRCAESPISTEVPTPPAFAVEPPRTRSRGASTDEPF